MDNAHVIIDTNIVIAGLPTARGVAPWACILDGMLNGAFRFAVSAELLEEYQEVLLRPKLGKLHRLTTVEITALIERIAKQALQLTPLPAAAAPDPGDQLLWDLLAAQADLLLVTADKALLSDKPMRGRVISPQAFVASALFSQQ